MPDDRSEGKSVPPPPWVQYPGRDPMWGGWRQGPGERWLLDQWLPSWTSLTARGRETYLDLWLAPPDWRDHITSHWMELEPTNPGAGTPAGPHPQAGGRALQLLLAVGFVVFVAFQVYANRANLAVTSTTHAAVWVVFLFFTAYSTYCSLTENIVRSVRQILKLHWGRQVGVDLYIGLSLTALLVHAMEGSPPAAALWTLSFYLFGNLTTLMYVAIHYAAIAARLAA